jgi:cell division protein FtsN
MPGGQAFSGWVGLMIGLSIGLAVALGVFLHYRNLGPGEPVAAAAVPPASAKASEPEAAAPVDPAVNYDFYDMLKTQNVEVPKAADPAPAAIPPGLRGDLMLQAGSFKSQDQAEKRQAKLALHGIESKIQRFTLDDETFYRVRIGPISTVEEHQALLTKLAEAEIEVAPMSTSVVDSPPP